MIYNATSRLLHTKHGLHGPPVCPHKNQSQDIPVAKVLLTVQVSGMFRVSRQSQDYMKAVSFSLPVQLTCCISTSAWIYVILEIEPKALSVQTHDPNLTTAAMCYHLEGDTHSPFSVPGK